MAGLFSYALLVEDERNLGVALEIALRKLGIRSDHAQTLTQAREFLENPQYLYDLIVLDRNLPDGDGLSLCAWLRNEGYSGTILILTAAGDTEDRILGLNEGADDYLPKPFSWEELEARVRALSRRRAPLTGKPGKMTPPVRWQIDEARLRIHGPNGWIELTPLEFKLAIKLIEAKGTIVSRDDLLKDVWGFTLLPKTRTVDHFLGRLRKHFEKNPEEPKHFLTVRGAGYRFEP
jgi:DNA-binding response OmpR family regulator